MRQARHEPQIGGASEAADVRARRVVFMDDGVVVEDGPPDRVSAAPREAFPARLLDPAAAPAPGHAS